MSSNTFTVKTAVQSAQPRSKRLRGLAGDVIIGSGSAGVVAGSVGEGHSHANKSLLDSLLSDEEGYLYIVGKTEDSDDSIAAKILAGSADKWAGHAWEEYMDQPLRSSDDVVFASVAVEKVVFTNGAILEVDGDYIKINKVLYSTKNLAVLGEGEDVPGGGGGASYNRLDTWNGYDNSTMAGYVLSAGLGFDINNRLTALENNGGGSTGNYLPSTTKYALSDKVGGDAMALYDYSQATATSATIAFIGGLSYSNEKLTNDDSVSSYVPIFFDDSEPTLQPMHKTEFLKFLGFTVGTDDKPVVGGDITDTLLTLWNNYSLEIQDKWALSAGLGYQLYQKAHTHDNKSVLDTITTAMVNKWNKNYLPTTTKYALSDAVGGDALQAKKLTWQRVIGLSGAVSSPGAYFNGGSNISIPVNYIYDDYIQNDWIPKNNNQLNSLTKLWISQFRANQIAFIDPDAITIQYSRDGGDTWINYRPRTTDDEIYLDNLYKKRFVSGINTNLSNFYVLGKATSYSELSNNNQLRIEIDTYKAKLDCNIRFIVPYINKHGMTTMYLTIDKRHTPTGTWTTLVNKVQINGEPGYNKINMPNGGIRTDVYNEGNGTTDSWHTRFIRFTFTQVISTTQTYGSFVYNIFSFGDTYTSPTIQGKTGMLYDYDEDQNMKLPAGLYTNRINFGNGCYIIADGDKLKVHGTIYSDSNVAVKVKTE